MTVSKILEATLVAGSTTVTFTDVDIPNSLIRVFSSNPDIIPESRTLIGNTLTVVYPAQSNNIGVAVEIVKQGLDIVDDLTSTDTDKALSAKQGKTLKDIIDGLPEVITNISDMNDVNITDIEAGQVLAWDGEKFVNVDQSGGSGVIDYSTSEQDTGIKWIDGKVIYQKTINFGNLPNATTKTVNHEISNIENVIDIKALAYYSGQVYGEMMPLVYAGHTFRIIVRSTYIEIQCPSDNWSSYGCYVTIYYTKTT